MCDPTACTMSWWIFHYFLYFLCLSVTKKSSSKCSWESTHVLLEQPAPRTSCVHITFCLCTRILYTPPWKFQVIRSKLFTLKLQTQMVLKWQKINQSEVKLYKYLWRQSTGLFALDVKKYSSCFKIHLPQFNPYINKVACMKMLFFENNIPDNTQIFHLILKSQLQHASTTRQQTHFDCTNTFFKKKIISGSPAKAGLEISQWNYISFKQHHIVWKPQKISIKAVANLEKKWPHLEQCLQCCSLHHKKNIIVLQRVKLVTKMTPGQKNLT